MGGKPLQDRGRFSVLAVKDTGQGTVLRPGDQRHRTGDGSPSWRSKTQNRPPSYYARAERQRNVMISLFEAYKELSYPQMLSLLHDILPLVRTNMTISEITGYAMQLYPMLTGAEVDTLRIPMDGTFKEGYVKVYEGKKLWCQYNIDFEANRKELEKVFE